MCARARRAGPRSGTDAASGGASPAGSVDGGAEPTPARSAADLGRRSDALAARLGVPRAAVRALLRQHPPLSELPLESLAVGVPELARALGVPLQQALFMVGRSPRVLDASPEALAMRAAALGAAAGLPAEQAMFLAARQPALLDAPPARVANEASKLGAALGCSPRGALQLLARLSPRQLYAVLGMSGSTVAQRLREVLDALGLPSDSTRALDCLALVAKHPGLLVAPPSDVGRSTDALLVVLGQSAQPDVAAILSRCPSLLTLPAEQLLANHQGLMLQLGVGRATAARMLTRHPQLLRMPPDVLALKLRAIAYQVYVPQQQVRWSAVMCCGNRRVCSCTDVPAAKRERAATRGEG
jgi:hypothetical protein